jgi:hypothetical protein
MISRNKKIDPKVGIAYPAQLVSEILLRALGPQGFKNLLEEYEGAKRSRRRDRHVTEKDMLIFMDHTKGGMNISSIARKHKITPAQASVSIRMAALSKLGFGVE